MQTRVRVQLVAVVVGRHWFEIGADDEEHGCRVELRVLPQLALDAAAALALTALDVAGKRNTER